MVHIHTYVCRSLHTWNSSIMYPGSNHHVRNTDWSSSVSMSKQVMIRNPLSPGILLLQRQSAIP